MTLADLWNLATDGKAVIIGQGGALRDGRPDRRGAARSGAQS